MSASSAPEILRLHVPPDPAQVATMRSFVGAIGRHAGCESDALDDLRLAVTEACAQVLDEDAAPEGFDLRSWVEDGGLVVEIEPAPTFESEGPPDPLDPASGERRWALVSALFPSAELVAGEPTAVLRIQVPIPVAG